MPTHNQLTDTIALRKAVEAADQYMNALHPTSVRTAIQAHQLRLESLDPRFRVQIDVINERKFVNVLAKEQVEGTLTFKGEPELLKSKLDDLIGRGLPTPFGPDEIEVTGSPLFSEAFKAGGILGVSQVLDGTVSLFAQDSSGQVLSALDNIPGTLTGGRNECRFEGQLADSPLKLHITVSWEGKSASIRFCFDVSRWHGQPIRFLPYFDQIAAFFEGVKDCTVLDLKCFLRGNEFFGGRIHQEDLSIFKKAAGFLPFLTKAREICRIAGLNPILNENIDREKARDILQLHKLLTEGEFRQKVRDAEISVTAPRSQIEKLITGPQMVDIPLVLASGEDQKVLLFGQQVVVGKLEYHFSHVKLVPTKKDLQERLAASRAKRIEVAFASMEHSELVIRRVNQ